VLAETENQLPVIKEEQQHSACHHLLYLRVGVMEEMETVVMLVIQAHLVAVAAEEIMS
tara:strand:- start:246 stop:419 length:174 start_codon:yes stop_codon:yes gene_type:complete